MRASGDGERGVALVLVLGVVSIVAVMAAHLVSVVEIAARECWIQSERESLRYQAESIAGETLWMHMTDRRLFPGRVLGRQAGESREDSGLEPWMMDRRPHLFNGGDGVSYLSAGDAGFDAGDPKSLQEGIPAEDTGLREATEAFLDVLQDYTDPDDLVKLNGMEAKEYADAGFPTLPRNDRMEYKAELYWLPGWQEAVPGEVAVIPPKGRSLPGARRRKPGFFSCSEADLARALGGLDRIEVESVLRARDEWMRNGALLEDTLDSDLLAKVRNAFDFKEHRLASVLAVAYDPGRQARAALREVREVDLARSSIFSDRRHETLSVWERFLE